MADIIHFPACGVFKIPQRSESLADSISTSLDFYAAEAKNH